MGILEDGKPWQILGSGGQSNDSARLVDWQLSGILIVIC